MLDCEVDKDKDSDRGSYLVQFMLQDVRVASMLAVLVAQCHGMCASQHAHEAAA